MMNFAHIVNWMNIRARHAGSLDVTCAIQCSRGERIKKTIHEGMYRIIYENHYETNQLYVFPLSSFAFLIEKLGPGTSTKHKSKGVSRQETFLLGF